MTKGTVLAAIGGMAILGLMAWSGNRAAQANSDGASASAPAESAPTTIPPTMRPMTKPTPPAPAPSAQDPLTQSTIRLSPPDHRGPVTHLPLPRYVSLKGSKGNARRGPSLSHRIDWVFTHPGMPLKVTAEFGHWRRVEDRDGQGGWIHYALISGVRHVVITQDMVSLHARPDEKAEVVAKAQSGAIARLDKCNSTWCEIDADGAAGWLPKTDIWGVDADEARD
ncbi:SH3 domain-containing protein [Thioclava sp.]|uniref:SH3 domain-containing protein n=1 Tax=Thioclava sp. TaxID=1933450 RepID=UPI003AA8CC08